MAALPDLITVAQFRNMPDDGRAYELHHGEIVCVGRPKAKHYQGQRKLVGLLETRLPSYGEVGLEYPYRPVAEFDLWAADVAMVSRTRVLGIDPEDNLNGAPDLVIEVKSPSNTERQVAELASLCLANGALEFWVVDLDRVSITVVRRDGTTSVFHKSDAVPLAAFGGDALAVDEIFG